jgi:type III secretion protein S
VEAISLFHTGLMMVVILSIPALAVTTILGIIVSLVQGLFQVQDQALSYTVKVIALAATLVLTARWMQSELVGLTNQMFYLLGQVR